MRVVYRAFCQFDVRVCDLAGAVVGRACVYFFFSLCFVSLLCFLVDAVVAFGAELGFFFRRKGGFARSQAIARETTKKAKERRQRNSRLANAITMQSGVLAKIGSMPNVAMHAAHAASHLTR